MKKFLFGLAGAGQVTIAEQCSADSGGKYTITTSLLPRDAATQREQLARRLAAGDRSMDIMSLDPPFIPELAEPGFLAAPQQELVETATQDTLEGAQAGAVDPPASHAEMIDLGRRLTEEAMDAAGR